MSQDPFKGYSSEPRPLRAYAVLIALFNGLFGAALWRLQRRPGLPERWSLGDLLLLGVATHQLSMLIGKDKVTSVLRAPFTQFDQPAGGPYVQETPRGGGLRLATGELLTCPYCVGQWVAALFGSLFVLRPRVARFIAAVFSILTISNLLHHAFAWLGKRAGY